MKKPKLLVFFLLLGTALFAQTNPSPMQTRFFQHSNNSSSESVVKALIYGEKTYVLLNTVDSIDLDYGPGKAVFSPEFQGNHAMILACYDIKGAFLWGKILGQGTSTQFGANFVQGEEMEFIDGGIVITGTGNGSVQLDPARTPAGEFQLANKQFIASYTVNGDFKWAKAQQIGFAYFKKLQTNKNQDKIYILGYCAGIADIDFGSGSVLIGTAPTNTYSTFVLVISTNGEYLNHYAIKPAENASTPGTTLPGDFLVFSEGKNSRILFTGSYNGSLTDGATLNLNTETNKKGAYIIKINDGGNYISHQLLSSSEEIELPSISIQTDMGTLTNYLVTGTFANDLTIGNQTISGYGINNSDLFIANFNANDSLIWTKTIQGQGLTKGRKIISGRFTLPGEVTAKKLNVVAATTFRMGNVNDDLDPGQAELKFNSPKAIAVLYFDEDGKLVMHNKIEHLQTAGTIELKNMHLDYMGEMVLSGNFQIALDMEDFPYLNDTILSKNNSIDFFVKRFHYCNDTISISNNNTSITVQFSPLNTDADFTWINVNTEKKVKTSKETSFTPSEAGKYLVIRVKDDCRAISNMVEYGVSSVQNMSSKNKQLLFYPNPANDYVNVLMDENRNGECKLKVYTLTGAFIKSDNLQWNNGKALLDITTLKEGMYILELELNDSRSSAYFIKN
ncbi:MAG: T9SS type A sorting domain-containing protein [Bacteroidia bacterium]